MAQRMHRYSIYLIVMAFLLMAVNMGSLSLEAVLWFASGLAAGFALLCAISVTILNAIAWNFDRMKEELKGGRQSTDLR
jgi:membrane protein YdbS with pleckstrin-like domain